MSVLAGNQVRIRVGGSPVSFTAESTESTDNFVYSIADKTKGIWHVDTPVIVYDGGVVTDEKFMIDYVNGAIIFPTSNARSITVTGAYVTTSIVGKAYKYSLSETYDIYDITCFEDNFRKRMRGEGSAEGEISDWDVIDTYYRDALLQGKPVLIEISHYEGDTDPQRLWAVLESREIASAIGNPQEATVSFQSTGKF